ARELAAENHQWLVFPRRKLLHGRALSRRGGARIDGRPATAGLSFALAWRGILALLRGAMSAPGHLHLRRAGVGAVAVPADRVPEAVAPHGPFGRVPSHHGDPLPDSDGLSQRPAVAALERWARPGAGRGHKSLPADARILVGPGQLHRDD